MVNKNRTRSFYFGWEGRKNWHAEIESAKIAGQMQILFGRNTREKDRMRKRGGRERGGKRERGR